jgi:hypothetical protein
MADIKERAKDAVDDGAAKAKWSVSQITSWLARSFILRSRSCEKMRQRAF